MTPKTRILPYLNRKYHPSRQGTPGEFMRSAERVQAPVSNLSHRIAQEVARCERRALLRETQLPHAATHLRGWRVDGVRLPAEGVGGDFYDLVPLEDGRIGVLIGDVSGKGVRAAQIMALVRPILRAEAATGVNPAEVLRRANEQIAAIMPAGCFLTALYALLNPMSGVVRVANAGHNQPLVRTLQGVERIDATGFPLGLFDDVRYDEESMIMKQGETLLLTTDGVTDARNESREHFGFGRLQHTLAQWDGASSGVVAHVLNAVRGFAGAFDEQDDVALLALRRG